VIGTISEVDMSNINKQCSINRDCFSNQYCDPKTNKCECKAEAFGRSCRFNNATLNILQNNTRKMFNMIENFLNSGSMHVSGRILGEKKLPLKNLEECLLTIEDLISMGEVIQNFTEFERYFKTFERLVKHDLRIYNYERLSKSIVKSYDYFMFLVSFVLRTPYAVQKSLVNEIRDKIEQSIVKIVVREAALDRQLFFDRKTFTSISVLFDPNMQISYRKVAYLELKDPKIVSSILGNDNDGYLSMDLGNSIQDILSKMNKKIILLFIQYKYNPYPVSPKEDPLIDSTGVKIAFYDQFMNKIYLRGNTSPIKIAIPKRPLLKSPNINQNISNKGEKFCQYWNENNRVFSTEGVYFQKPTNESKEFYFCETTHLSYFVVKYVGAGMNQFQASVAVRPVEKKIDYVVFVIILNYLIMIILMLAQDAYYKRKKMYKHHEELRIIKEENPPESRINKTCEDESIIFGTNTGIDSTKELRAQKSKKFDKIETIATSDQLVSIHGDHIEASKFLKERTNLSAYYFDPILSIIKSTRSFVRFQKIMTLSININAMLFFAGMLSTNLAPVFYYLGENHHEISTNPELIHHVVLTTLALSWTFNYIYGYFSFYIFRQRFKIMTIHKMEKINEKSKKKNKHAKFKMIYKMVSFILMIGLNLITLNVQAFATPILEQKICIYSFVYALIVDIVIVDFIVVLIMGYLQDRGYKKPLRFAQVRGFYHI